MAVRLSPWAPPIPLLVPDRIWPPPRYVEECANALVQWKNDYGEVVIWQNRAAQLVYWKREEEGLIQRSRLDLLGRIPRSRLMFIPEHAPVESY